MVPYWIERLVSALEADRQGGLIGLLVLRMLRLSRLMRIFKLGRHGQVRLVVFRVFLERFKT